MAEMVAITLIAIIGCLLYFSTLVLSDAKIMEIPIKMAKESSAHCVNLIENRSMKNVHSNLDFPLISFNPVSFANAMKKNKQEVCSFFVLKGVNASEIVEVGNFLSPFLKKRDWEFAAILERAETSKEVEQLLTEETFVDFSNFVAFFSLKSRSDIVWAAPKGICPKQINIFPLNNGKNGNVLGKLGKLPNQIDATCLELRVTSFPREPFFRPTGVKMEAKKRPRDPPHEGIEGLLLHGVARDHGFSYRVRRPSDGELWGIQIKPGVFNGLVGDLQFRRSDVGFANIFMTAERLEVLDFAETYAWDYVHFFVKKPEPLSQAYAIIISFGGLQWATFGAFSVTSVLFGLLYSVFYSKAEFSATSTLTYLTAALLDESLPYTWRIRGNGFRMFLYFFLLMSMILTQMYRSELTSNLSVQVNPKPLDTIKQVSLDIRPVSSFIGAFLPSVRKSIDPDIQRLVKKYSTHRNYEEAFKNASQGELIMGESKRFLDYSIRQRFTNRFGETSLHISADSLISFQVAFGLSRDSLYTRMFSISIRKLREGGLIQKFIDDEMDRVAFLAKKQISFARDTRPWDLADLQGPFLLHLLLLAITLLIFLVEMVKFKCKF